MVPSAMKVFLNNSATVGKGRPNWKMNLNTGKKENKKNLRGGKFSVNTHSRLIRRRDVRDVNIVFSTTTPESSIALPLHSNNQ